MKMNYMECPVCGYHQSQKAFTAKDHFVSGQEFAIHACIRCGLLQTADVPNESESGAYYQSETYISHSNTRKGVMNQIYHLVRGLMLTRKHALISQVSDQSNGTLLDIGAGTGYFMNFMQQKGWQVQATEKSPEARKYAKQHMDVDIQDEDMLFSFQPASFDVVTLWHVMEHLPNLNQYWQVISKILKPDGALIVALPNAKSWDAKHYGPNWAAWDVPRHLWHFSPKHIRELGKKEGFRLSGIRRMPFDAFYISIMSEKNINSSFPIIRGIFQGIRSWAASLYSKKKSSSLIYIFRRSN